MTEVISIEEKAQLFKRDGPYLIFSTDIFLW